MHLRAMRLTPIKLSSGRLVIHRMMRFPVAVSWFGLILEDNRTNSLILSRRTSEKIKFPISRKVKTYMLHSGEIIKRQRLNEFYRQRFSKLLDEESLAE